MVKTRSAASRQRQKYVKFWREASLRVFSFATDNKSSPSFHMCFILEFFYPSFFNIRLAKLSQVNFLRIPFFWSIFRDVYIHDFCIFPFIVREIVNVFTLSQIVLVNCCYFNEEVLAHVSVCKRRFKKRIAEPAWKKRFKISLLKSRGQEAV